MCQSIPIENPSTPLKNGGNMVEILLEQWWNDLGAGDLPLPLEAQAKLISKKYEIANHVIPLSRYDSETERDITEDTEVTMINFKDVVVKFRPHLHMGDMWLHVKVVNSSPQYKFYYKVEFDGKTLFHVADHPHLSGGVPCLGSHQGDLNTCFTECNFIRFMSQMRTYLSSYYGRSTYTRGSEYKKAKIDYKLHGYNEVYEMFHDQEHNDGELDVIGIGKDPMRWNWPKEMAAFGQITLEGQELRYFYQYLRATTHRLDVINKEDSPFPYLDNINPYRSMFSESPYNTREEKLAKILGYIAICHKIGEMTVFQSIEFVRIFILKLWMEYMGAIDEEVMKSLRRMSRCLNDAVYRNKWNINARYSVILDEQRRSDVNLLDKEIRQIVGTNGEEAKFIDSLKFAGHKFSNFMILLRKRKPESATCEGYLTGGIKQDVNHVDINKRFNKIEKFVYRKALDQLEKDKRRFINELNRPEIVHIQTDDGQATLFSQEL